MQSYLIAYDIADSKRLRKIHALVASWGIMQQKSLYESAATRSELIDWARMLMQQMQEEDRAHLIHLLGSPLMVGRPVRLIHTHEGVIYQ
jgi:CRISPR-associated endonuclease Cas2